MLMNTTLKGLGFRNSYILIAFVDYNVVSVATINCHYLVEYGFESVEKLRQDPLE